MPASEAALVEHHKNLKKTWGINPVVEANIPGKSLDEFCKEIATAHVD